MTAWAFIKKWGNGIRGQWWTRDAARVYWAASYEMDRERLTEMSRDFLNLSNFDVQRGTSSATRALELCAEERPDAVQ